MVRALFFLNSFSGGGAEKVCLNLAKCLYAQKIESDFVIIYDKKADYEIPSYIHILSLGLKDPFLTRLSIIKQIPKVNAFISGKEYVLITAHLYSAQYLASLSKVRNKTLYVMHVTQHLKDNDNSFIYYLKLKRFLGGKHVVTVSNGLKDELNKEYNIDAKNIVTIYNPCILNSIEDEDKRETLPPRPYILFMGRLEKQKNPMLALELYYMGGFYKKYDLVFLGKGSLENSLKKRINEYNLANHVFLIGFRKRPEWWLTNASLLLSCSKYEGFAMNLVEALLCGTPVVASDCAYGPNEILTDKLSDYLLCPEYDFSQCISIIASALDYYPDVEEKYYYRFDGNLILQIYLEKWKEYFGYSVIF